MRRPLRILLLLGLLTGAQRLRAQEPAAWRSRWQSARDSTHALLERGDYNKAAPYADTVLLLARRFARNDSNYRKSLYTAAEVYRKLERFRKAAPLYHDELALSVARGGPTAAAGHYHYALFCYSKSDYRRADRYYRLAAAYPWPHDSTYSSLLNDWALVQDALGNPAAAIGLLRRSLQVKDSLSGKEHPDYATSLANLASAYRSTGRLDTAILLLEEALAIRRRVQGNGHPYYPLALGQLAGIYLDQGAPERAEALYTSTLQELDPSGNNYPDVLIRVGRLYQRRARYDSALQCYRQARSLIAATAANEAAYRNVLADLADCFADGGRPDSADAIYREWIRLTERKAGTGTAYADALAGYAGFLRKTGRNTAAARAYLRQVADIYRQSAGTLSIGYIRKLRALGAFYYDQYRYAEAARCYQEALRLGEQVYGRQHPDYAATLNDLANVYADQKRLRGKAEALYRQSLQIDEAIYGRKNANYLVSLYNLAAYFNKTGQPARALPLYRELAAGRRELFGERHPGYRKAVVGLAETYEALEDNSQAIDTYKKLIVLCRMVEDTLSENYLSWLNSLAVLYDKEEDYGQALPLYSQVLALRIRTSGRSNPECAQEFRNLAYCYQEMDSLEQALPLYREALALWKRGEGVRSESYADACDELLELYGSLGRYTEMIALALERANVVADWKGSSSGEYALALKAVGAAYYGQGRLLDARHFYQAALQIFRKTKPGSEDVSVLTDDLANTYSAMGEFARAIPLYEESLAITLRLFGKVIDYATTLNNLGSAYDQMGDLKKAEQCIREALAIVLRIKGKGDPKYAGYLSDLAAQLKYRRKYGEALAAYEEAVRILTAQRESKRLAHVLNGLGDLYRRQGQYSKAREAFTRASAIILNRTGKESQDYTVCLSHQINLFRDEKNFPEAIRVQKELQAIRKKVIGINARGYIDGINSLAYLHFRSGRQEEARGYLLQGLRQWYAYLRRQLGSFSAREQEKMLAEFSGPQEIALSAQQQWFPGDSEFRNTLFHTIAGYNGLVLQGQSLLSGWALRQRDSSVLRRYQEWRTRSEELTIALQQGGDVALLDSLEQATDDAQKTLLQAAPSFAKVFQQDTISTTRVARSLQPGEVLVNWVPYRWYTPERGATDSVFYGAFILRPGSSAPQFLNVFEQAPLQQALRFYYNKGDRGIGVRNRADSINMDSLQKRLYQLVWQPLEPYLQGAKRVYLLPGGLLNKLSFSALIGPRDSFLIDRYELHTILNIRDLESRSPTGDAFNRVSLFGGALYDSSSTAGGAPGPDSTEATARYLPGKASRAAGDARFRYLEGTRREVLRIDSLLAGRSRLFVGTAASEGNFKRQSGNAAPGVLHIATHGFYFPQQQGGKEAPQSTGERFRQSDQPLLRSGLVLSGVNRYWNSSAPPGTEDGILTAQEIAGLDFSEVQLVVLSACQTALGDINNTQGVYGLQRAFRMAGVPDMIISLWEVPDAETAELMTAFYSGLAAGRRPYEAFRVAQQQLKDKYHDPHKWAAFLLLGE
ncbi:CHAT domain-containing protein [Flaviaesturariibacter aridisoli]|uniref:Tetratricopeptide repeat protein n=1 Tax=Flaviaesturariibacter aridisoli TaxID=2545761 RepID=A0A4R4E184_9BACT|nr:CHAT domain-containing protein [Flaviaesturariibacter aridisoli]TCZ71808.1 tetratricopeptide repeat protein [Flaviaesturariibacter aridisoli]